MSENVSLVLAIRMRLPHAPRHLVTAHLAAIIQGAMLIALSAAAAFSTLPSGLETLAASLLVAGCVLFVAGAVADWLQAVEDHCAARSLGWKLLATSGPLNLIGISLLLVGVLKALSPRGRRRRQICLIWRGCADGWVAQRNSAESLAVERVFV